MHHQQPLKSAFRGSLNQNLENERENSDQSLSHLLLRHNNEKARVNRLKALANIK